jgi:hypothetical protein
MNVHVFFWRSFGGVVGVSALTGLAFALGQLSGRFELFAR